MNGAPANPFVLGKYLDDNYFCDREEETRNLEKLIVNGHNIVLISPRRMGKSGLIHHFFAQKEIKDKYFTAYADIYATRSLTDLVYLLANAIYASVKGGFRNQVERFFKSLTSLRLSFKFDCISGEPILELQPGQLKSPHATLDELFAYLEDMPRPVIVAIDEFQQVAEYADSTVEALLRSYIQRCKNAQFIYSGSKRHMLSNMFMSYAKPFYQSATLMSLGKIDADKYCDFAIRLFRDYGKDVQRPTVIKSYERGEGITWYIQAIMNELFAGTPVGDVCTEAMIEPAVSNLIAARADFYIETMARLTDKQKGLLIAIAKSGEVCSPTSAEFVQAWSLDSASSVQAAMKSLLKQEIITREDNTYRVPDILFAEWLRAY